MPQLGTPIDSPGARTVRMLSGRALFRVAEAIRDNMGAQVMQGLAEADRMVPVEEHTPTRAFAVQIQLNTLNVAGVLAGDTAVVEPATEKPPKNGEPVAVLQGEKVGAYHYHPPYVVPRSTDPKAVPVSLDDVIVLGAIRQIIRKLS